MSDSTPLLCARTRLGEFRLRLDAAAAPQSVPRILARALLGLYDQSLVERAIPDFAGCFGRVNARGDALPAESHLPFEPGLREDLGRGSVGLMRGPALDSASGALFVCLGDLPWLAGGPEARRQPFCVLGRIEEGLDVLDRIARELGDWREPHPQPVLIEEIRPCPNPVTN